MSDLYSNCVILEFSKPITRAQLDLIYGILAGQAPSLPNFKSHPICAEREGNSVIPTIVADEC